MSKKTQVIKKKSSEIKAKIVIDTNKLVEILQAWSLSDIKEILGKSKALVFTRQIYDEFVRNSDEIIDSKLNDDYKLLPDIQLYGYSEELKSNLLEIKKQINFIKEDLKKELTKKRELIISIVEKNIVIETTEDILKNARQRKEKGNPPSSGTSIGDEIIWESLLSWGGDNLVLFSGDFTWHNNQYFLKREYEFSTSKILVDVVRNIKDIKDIIGLQDEALPRIEETERVAELSNYNFSYLQDYLKNLKLASKLSSNSLDILMNTTLPIVSSISPLILKIAELKKMTAGIKSPNLSAIMSNKTLPKINFKEETIADDGGENE